MRNTVLSACLSVSFAFSSLASAAEPVVGLPATDREPKIQVAVLLDTSSSMDGLINQTREQLWKIVNTFASAKRDGKRPRLELALYDYGNDSISAGNDYVRKLVPLTTDLDKVSEALFKLKTNGGNEYCGAAIAHATKELAWSRDPHDLKLIYIAGNEAFTQGTVRYQDSVKAAIELGIVVNTIHAGDEATGVAGQWLAAAKMADGNYLFIDQNRAVARVDAPQDAKLAALSTELNKTYVAYGVGGAAAAQRQVAQDSNAVAASPSSGAMRAKAKGSASYKNSNWDLVDAKDDGLALAAVPAASLPAEMKDMSVPERERFVAGKSAKRAELQAEIAKVSAERDAFVASEMKKQAEVVGPKTMDEALLDSARVQAKKKAFAF